MRVDADSLLLELRETAAHHGDVELRQDVAEALHRATIRVIEPSAADPTTLTGTAAITRVGASRYQIVFWQAFIERAARTAEDRLFLFLHEMAHQRHGDLVRQYLTSTPDVTPQVVNVAEDMVINAELCQRWFPTGVPMLYQMITDARKPGERLMVFNHLLVAPMAIIDIYREEITKRYPDMRWLKAQHVTYADLHTWGARNFAEMLQTCLASERSCPIAGKCLADIAQVYVHGWFLQAPIWRLAVWMTACLRHCPQCEEGEAVDVD
jgi:hypothetical protein